MYKNNEASQADIIEQFRKLHIHYANNCLFYSNEQHNERLERRVEFTFDNLSDKIIQKLGVPMIAWIVELKVNTGVLTVDASDNVESIALPCNNSEQKIPLVLRFLNKNMTVYFVCTLQILVTNTNLKILAVTAPLLYRIKEININTWKFPRAGPINKHSYNFNYTVQ